MVKLSRMTFNFLALSLDLLATIATGFADAAGLPELAGDLTDIVILVANIWPVLDPALAGTGAAPFFAMTATRRLIGCLTTVRFVVAGFMAGLFSVGADGTGVDGSIAVADVWVSTMVIPFLLELLNKDEREYSIYCLHRYVTKLTTLARNAA